MKTLLLKSRIKKLTGARRRLVLVTFVVCVVIGSMLPGSAFAAPTKVVFITTTGSGTWTVPSDFSSLVSVEVIGGGGGGRSAVAASSSAGGGGGAYSKITSMSLTPGQSVPYSVATSGTPGLPGGNTVFGTTSLAGCVTLGSSACVGAEGGKGGTGVVSVAGGSSTNGVGTTKYSGGNSGAATASAGNGGGGGAAGPIGDGKNGAQGDTNTAGNDGGGGGGGSNGGTSSAGTAGGTTGGAGGNGTGGTGGGAANTEGTQGTGGGGGGGNQTTAGGAGATSTSWTQSSNSVTAGPGGGGGGGGNGGNGGAGGTYGGGGGGGITGGTGGQGIIVITYVVATTFILSGTLYSDEGVTQITTTNTIKLSAGTSTPGLISTTTSPGTGYFEFQLTGTTSIATSTPLVVWVDNSATRAVRFSKASSTAFISGFNLYKDRVIVTHEATAATTTRIADMAFYDNRSDDDIQYRASTTANTFTVMPGNELYIPAQKHFVPGGAVTVLGNASSSVLDGSLRLKASSTFEQAATTTLAGSFYASTSANYLKTAGGLTFNASTTGKTITGGTLGGGLGDVLFSGGNQGAWTFTDNASTSNFTLATGTVTMPSALSVRGTYSNNGTSTNNGGDLFFTATTSMATGTLTGTSALGDVALVPVGDVATWTTRSAANDNYWFSVAYGSSTFVAVAAEGGTNRVMTSPDGVNWTARTSSNESGAWRSVTYGTSSFVAISLNGDVMTSFDNGATWSAQTPAEANAWTSVTYGNGLFVAVAYSGGTNRVMTSPNGINWTAISAAGNNDGWYSVTYGEGLFVAVSEAATSNDYIMTSTDGINWTARTSPGLYNTWISITYGNGLFVAVGLFEVMTSPDGITWTVRTNPAFSVWTSVTYGNGLFVAVAQDSIDASNYRTMTSPDGITWTAIPASVDSMNWSGVAYGNGTLVAVGSTTPADNNRVMTASNFGSSLTFGTTSASTTDLTITASTTLYAPRNLSIAGNYVVNGTTTHASTTFFTGVDKTISGSLSGVAALGDVVASGTYTFLNNASTSDITITSTGSLEAPSSRLSVAGDLVNNGTFINPVGVLEMTAYIKDYIAGRDISGSSNGTDSAQALVMAVKGTTTLYVGINSFTGAACSQSAGSAAGCEIQVYDITDSTSPRYVAGRDTDGSSSGTTVWIVQGLFVHGDYLYVAKNASSTACSQVAGSAGGCEMMVFDISSSTNPTYVAGRDSNGTSNGSAAEEGREFGVSGNILYFGRFSNGGTCSSSDGTGCEILMFDNTTPTNPTYIGGVDVANTVHRLTVSGDRLYVGTFGGAIKIYDISSTTNPQYKSEVSVGRVRPNIAVRENIIAVGGPYGGGGTCAGTTTGGNCETRLYDVSSSTNPQFLAGIDSDGSMQGVANENAWALAFRGNSLIVGSAGNSTPCTPVAGSASGCELKIYDISSTTNPLLMGGRDAGGFLGVVNSPVRSLALVKSDYLYVGKHDSTTACSDVDATGCEVFAFRLPSYLSGTLTGTSALGNVVISGLASSTANASTTDLTITSGGIFSAPPVLTVAGDYANNGQFIHNTGSVTFSGTDKNISGTLVASSSFNNLEILSGADVAVWSELLVEGNYTNNGTFTSLGKATTTFSGNGKTWSGSGATTFANVDIQGSYTSSLPATTTHFAIASGTSFTKNANLTVSGNYTNDGTFTATAGNTTFIGASSTVSGNLTGTSALGDVVVYPGGNGVLWSTTTAAGDDDVWNSVTYGNGLFVAVGDASGSGDAAMTSLDGVAWSTTTAAGDDDVWNSVTYGNGLFVAVGAGSDVVMTSSDGVNWFTRSAAGNNDSWYGVSYGNGLFVAVGNPSGGGDVVMTSPDGIIWTAHSASGDDETWSSVTYGNGLFVAVGPGYGGATFVMTSPDGVTWTDGVAANEDIEWNSVTYGNGLFVAVGMPITGESVMTSSDGVNWTARSVAEDNDSWNSVTYGNGLFVAVGDSGDRLMTSPDGVNWTARSVAGDNDSWSSVTNDEGGFVAVGRSGDRVMTSSQGILSLAGLSEASTTNLTVAASKTLIAPDVLDVAGDYTNNGTFEHSSGIVLLTGASKTLAGDLVATSSFNNLKVTGSYAAANNASTTNFMISGGSFVAPNAFTIAGDYVNNGGVFTAGSGVTTFAGSNKTISGTTTGTGALGNIAVTGLYSFSNAASTTDITIPTGGTLYSGGRLSVAGNFTNNGTFDAIGGATTTFTGSSKTWSGSGTTTFANVDVRGTYTSTHVATTSKFTVASGGSFDNNANLSVTADYVNNGTFTAAAGELIFKGASSTISGNLGGTNTLGAVTMDASASGLNWQVRSDPASGCYAIGYGNGRFICLATGAEAYSSDDNGLTWTSRTLTWPSYVDPLDVIFANGQFVATGNWGYGEGIMTSPDGATWTAQTEPAGFETISSITYGNGLYVAVGTDFTNAVLVSPDAVDWSAVTVPGVTGLSSVTYGNGLFVAVTTGKVSVSSDGVNWTTSSVAEGDDSWNDVVYGNGVFVATGFSGDDRVMTSPDGVNWTTGSIFGDNDQWVSLAYGNGVFIVGGSFGASATEYVGVSVDGINWTIGTSSGEYLKDIVIGNGVAIAVNQNASFLISSTGDMKINNNASTTDLLITASGTVTAPSHLTVVGDYQNSGTFDANAGTLYLAGSSQQTVTGILSATSSLHHLQITNTSGTGSTTPAVIFDVPVETTGTFTMRASTSAQFLANATNTFAAVHWGGAGAAAPVYLRSSVPDTQWNFTTDSFESVAYVNVKDSYNGSAATATCSTGCTDAGNNTRWDFSGIPVSPGVLTIGEHVEGQADNQFSFQNKTDVPLLRFSMTAATETITVDQIVFALEGNKDIVESNLQNLALYIDVNADGLLDGGDTQIMGTGTLSITGETGTITFDGGTTNIATSSVASYLLIGSTVAITNNSYITVYLHADDISATGDTSFLPVTVEGGLYRQHSRSTAGGSGGNRSPIGGDAPTGNSVETGGTSGGGSGVGEESDGENIASDPNYLRPSSNGSPHNEWTSGGNAYASDGSFASAASVGLRQTYGGFGFAIPGGNTIQGIAVKVDASGSTAAGTIEIGLSWDGGTTITSVQATPVLSGSDIVYIVGDQNDVWGRGWSPADFDDSNFRVRVIAQPSSNTVRLDAIEVRVYHAATGGGGGGGGEI